MADEKKTVKETQENGKLSKVVAFFKNLPQNIATPFKNMWHELKKVTWPTKQDLIKYSCIVLIFMLFMGIVIGLLDMGSSRLVTAISSLKGTEEQVATEDITAVTDAENAAETVQEAADQAAETVQKAADQAAETVQETAEQAAETVKETAEQAAETVKETADQAAETVKENAEQAAENVKEAADQAAETVQEEAAGQEAPAGNN